MLIYLPTLTIPASIRCSTVAIQQLPSLLPCFVVALLNAAYIDAAYCLFLLLVVHLNGLLFIHMLVLMMQLSFYLHFCHSSGIAC
jgi:hypothetical protein